MRKKMRLPTVSAALILLPLALGGLVALALGVPWASSTGSASPGGPLACSVKASCGAGEVRVLRMSSLSNAHGGTGTGSAYGYSVCCGGVAGLGTSCAATPTAVALSLSATDNAHVASDDSYGTDVCVSGYGDDATADCAYGPSCDAEYACLATIWSDTNSHVADCDGVDDYATKVCCQVSEDNCPTVSNPGQEDADGDGAGDACDTCAGAPDPPWPVPASDPDCDGFSTADEGAIGTDPADNCPDDPADDAWPCDFDMNTVINITDVFNVLPPVFGSSAAIPDTNGDGIIDWSIRRDLWPDGVVNITDVFKVLPPYFGSSCTP